MELKEQQVKTLNKIFDKSRTKDDKETLQQKMKITWRKGRMRSMPRKTDEILNKIFGKNRMKEVKKCHKESLRRRNENRRKKPKKDQERL